MKIIIKYGVISGLLMLFFTFATIIPYLKYYIDESIVRGSKFVIIGGTNLYGINAYLKSGKASNYSYGRGALICLGIGLIASIIYALVFIQVNFRQYDLLVNLPRIVARIMRFLPLIILCSVVIPFFFRNKKKEANSIRGNDILDNDLNTIE